MPELLPREWVDEIFKRLTIRFGTGFTNKYAGLNMEDVKVDWQRCLAGFQANPNAISYAFDHLSDASPNANHFRDLCRQAPSPKFDALPAPTAADSPAQRQAISELVKRACKAPKDPLEWARSLKAREEAGERLTLYQRDIWRRALRFKEDE